MFLLVKRSVRSIFALCLSLSAVGCASSLLRDGQQQGALPQGSAIMFAPSEVGEDALTGLARSALTQQLEKRGHTVVATAPLMMEFALSTRPTDTQIGTPAKGSTAQKEPFFRLCDSRIIRLEIAAFDAARKSVTFRGAAEARRCGTLNAKILAKLADRALGRSR